MQNSLLIPSSVPLCWKFRGSLTTFRAPRLEIICMLRMIVKLMPKKAAKNPTKPRNCCCHHRALPIEGVELNLRSIDASLPRSAPVNVARVLDVSPLHVTKYPSNFVSGTTGNKKTPSRKSGHCKQRELAGTICAEPSFTRKCAASKYRVNVERMRATFRVDLAKATKLSDQAIGNK